MVRADVLKRVEILYRRVKTRDIPTFIFVKLLENGRFQVTENFFGGENRSNVFTVQSYADYKPPEGYKGVILIDNITE